MLDKQTLPIKSDHELDLYVFTSEEAQKYWDEIEPFIMRSVAVSFGTLSLTDVYSGLCNSNYVAIATLRDNLFTAVMVVRRIDYSTYSSLRIVAISGRNLRAAFDWLPDIEQFGGRLGAIEFEAWCRPSMVRLLRRWGWTPKLTQMVKPFRRILQ